MVCLLGAMEIVNFLVTNTRLKFANLRSAGLYIEVKGSEVNIVRDCQFESSHNVPVILFVHETIFKCLLYFSNNTGGHSVILLSCRVHINNFVNLVISDNNMTGITLFGTSIDSMDTM